MSCYWSAVVRDLNPYVPGEQPKLPDLIKLNTNENPYGPSPQTLEAIRNEVGDDLKLYPDPNADSLRSAIADYFGIARNRVFVGNGSDEVLGHVFHALLKHDRPILFPDISYSFYPVYCGLYGIEYQVIPLDASFAINPADYRQPNGGIIFPNPNAPTGRLLSLDAVETLVSDHPDSVVVVDEAYIDFGGESAVPLVERHANLLVVQSFSKSRSLAGLRVGFAIGHEDLIQALIRVKDSFNSYPLGRLAIVGASAAMADRAHFEATCQAVMKSRAWLVNEMNTLGFEVLPSAANFIFARHPHHQAVELAQALRERNIIVRHFRQARIDQFLRITIGTDSQCQALIHALGEILAR